MNLNVMSVKWTRVKHPLHPLLISVMKNGILLRGLMLAADSSVEWKLNSR